MAVNNHSKLMNSGTIGIGQGWQSRKKPINVLLLMNLNNRIFYAVLTALS
jgi:hypothetical protein